MNMRVFKFGGASVKDAKGIENLALVLQKVGHKNTLIVVSAMGKTTNALELLIANYLNDTSKVKQSLETLKSFHINILIDLFKNERHPVFKKVDVLIEELSNFLSRNKSPDYNYIYDQTLS
jgi:aspartate kinase